MKIQSIEKYKGSTYCVEFYEDKKIYLNQEIISDYNLKPDMEIPHEAIDDITHSSDLRRARERALYLLGFRDHSYKELFDKLDQNYSEDICMEICDRMVSIGLVNDKRYAEKLARDFIEVKHYGSYRARYDMQRKGIDRELIDAALEPYEDDTIDRLTKLVERKYTRYLIDKKGVQKVKSALARQGYSYSDVNAVLEEYIDTIEE